MIYTHVSQKFVVAVFALFPPILLGLKIDCGNFFSHLKFYPPDELCFWAFLAIFLSFLSFDEGNIQINDFTCNARGPDSMSGDSVQARKDQNLEIYFSHCQVQLVFSDFLNMIFYIFIFFTLSGATGVFSKYDFYLASFSDHCVSE